MVQTVQMVQMVRYVQLLHLHQSVQMVPMVPTVPTAQKVPMAQLVLAGLFHQHTVVRGEMQDRLRRQWLNLWQPNPKRCMNKSKKVCPFHLQPRRFHSMQSPRQTYSLLVEIRRMNLVRLTRSSSQKCLEHSRYI